MDTETARFFDAEKSSAFISREKGGEPFVHYASTQRRGRRGTEVGRQVEYQVGLGHKGDEVQNARAL